MLRPLAVALIACLAVAVLVYALWFSRPAASVDPAVTARPPSLLQEIARLPPELRESSGLAVSRTQPGVLWSHNDSGDGPNLYAIDSTGRLLQTVVVRDATARDWEDIATGSCPEGLASSASTGPAGGSCLYVGDIGDNNRVRKELTVYVLVEPVVERGGSVQRVVARSFRYRYPDQPHDGEALAVLPDGGVTIVSKGRTGTIDFFGLTAAQVAHGLVTEDVLTASLQGNTGIEPDQRRGRLVTGAALSPDGTTLAVRTYYDVFFFGRVPADGAVRWQDLDRGCSLGDAEPQGEAIDYLDADHLLLTSETTRSRPGTIHRLQC